MPEPNTPRLIAAIAATLLLAVGPTGASEKDVTEKLQSVEKALSQGLDQAKSLDSRATILEREVSALQAQLVTHARALGDREAELETIERHIADLRRRAREKAVAQSRNRANLVATYGALQKLHRQPHDLFQLSLESVVQRSRASLLLGGAANLLEQETDELVSELEILTEIRHEIASQHARLAEVTAAVARDQERLDGLVRQKSALQRKTLEIMQQKTAKIQKLAREASDLRALVEGLSVPPPPTRRPPSARPSLTAAQESNFAKSAWAFVAARGTLPMPVHGRVVGTFGETTNGGERRKGITIETRPGASVITPYDGQVVFAGPFRAYGQLLIIEHGEGYHTLLAGFSRIDSVLGQWLLAGEPVGGMGKPANGKPVLYVELRRAGIPINPLPWLAASIRKVSG